MVKQEETKMSLQKETESSSESESNRGVDMLLELLNERPMEIFDASSRETLVSIAQLLVKDIVKEQQVKLGGSGGGLLDDVVLPLDQLYSTVDGETVYGQVDILLGGGSQQGGLSKVLKKSLKNMAKIVENGNVTDKVIRVVDLSEIHGDEENPRPVSESSDEDANGSSDSDDDDEDEDEDARRIRERMERSMAEAGNSTSEEDDDEEADGDDELKEEEIMEDPAAEVLNDGFFDINEMEGFADEEEDFHMPNDADLNEDSDEGEEDNDDNISSSEDENNENDILFSENKQKKQKVKSKKSKQNNRKERKFRSDEDVEALTSIYGTESSIFKRNDFNENMTAADFFGAPNSKYLGKNQWRRKKNAKQDDDQSYDSWDDHDFNEGQKKKLTSWRDEDEGNSDDEVDDDNENEDTIIEEEGNNALSFAQSHENREAVSSGRDDKVDQQITELEKEALAEKPWAMRGEVQGKDRPESSLLEALPEFEHAAKMAPDITIEHTETLEDMIRRRILEEDWDDVVPRELPDIGGRVNGELPEVSQEKSKLGLGELYEREYLKKAVGYDVEAAEKQSVEEKAKAEMRSLFANLCSKLDALSNYHFAPRPLAAEEAEIKTSAAPAIALEEVLPLHVSDARAAAPEDVYNSKRGRESVLKGDSEMDQTERKRLRGAKKAARRKARKAKLADEKLISRLQPGLGLNNPYEKRKLREELAEARSRGKIITDGKMDANSKDYTQSTSFFKNLQDGNMGTAEKYDSANKKKSSSSFKL